MSKALLIITLLLGALLTTSFYPGVTDEPQEDEPCLSFLVGSVFFVDRGYETYDAGSYIECDTLFRYQEEQFGATLYIYDRTGTLKARVINPEGVTIR